jgi:D-alanine-D-alanine ligase
VSTSKFLLSPTNEERAGTHVLFLARHALDSSPERTAKYGYHVTYHAILLKTLRKLGFKVTPAADHEALLGPLDYDFLYAIHSHAIFDGHELLAPAIAAYRGVACLGAAAPTRAISEDKVLAKQVAASIGLDVARHEILTPGKVDVGSFNLPGSWIVKPRGGIASDGIFKVENKAGWRDALTSVLDPRHDGRDFIAEEFVPGLNLTIPIIEGFPPLTFAVFEEKGRAGDNVLTNEGKRGLNPSYSSAPYEGPGAQEAAEAAAELAAAISPFDYARFDFRYDPAAHRLVFIEVNIGCNMAPASVINRAVMMHGIDYEGLVGHVLTHSLRRQRKRPKPATGLKAT